MTAAHDYARNAAADLAYPDTGKAYTGWLGPSATALGRIVTVPRADWQTRAACRGMGPSLFYPDHGAPGVAANAVAVCEGCPVRAECAEAGGKEWHGWWGGLTVNERQRPERVRRPVPIDHGTYAGYQLHKRRGIPACDACRQANSAYITGRRQGLAS